MGLDLELERNEEFVLVERKKEYSRLEESKEKKMDIGIIASFVIM